MVPHARDLRHGRGHADTGCMPEGRRGSVNGGTGLSRIQGTGQHRRAGAK